MTRILNLAMFVVLGFCLINSAYACSWEVIIGGDQVAATDPSIPAGFNKYIIIADSATATHSIVSYLKAHAPATDVTNIRELHTIPMITLTATKVGIRYICKQDSLDKLIDNIELDQSIALFSDAVL